MNKKGQGISITVIIVAVIALVVLIVLVSMFVMKIGWWAQEVTIPECAETCFKNAEGASVHGQVITGVECPDGWRWVSGAYDDVGPGQLCCINDMIDVDELGCE